jgi:16S rRNA (cytosine1402-N4)-methyltransferase
VRRRPENTLSNLIHQPVMLNRVAELFSNCPAGVLIDATISGGGHLKGVFRVSGDRFRYIGFDLDGLSLKQTKKDFAKLGLKAELVKANFSEISEYLQRRKISTISAILYDLGISSYQIDNPERGFSYLADGPLSMSFDDTRKLAAADLIAKLSEKELADLFKSYGQERRARSLSKAIKKYPEKITTTGQLAQIIRSVVKDRFFIKTAAKCFMAIRIRVNNEFENIEKSLAGVLPLLAFGGRAIVISYNSLEDGLVKRIFKKFSGKCICPPGLPACQCGKQKLVRPVFAKPIRADPDEVLNNRRAHSARLRVVERIETTS